VCLCARVRVRLCNIHRSDRVYQDGALRGTVVVLGGGIAGVASARFLANCGFRVTILESRLPPQGRGHKDRKGGSGGKGAKEDGSRGDVAVPMQPVSSSSSAAAASSGSARKAPAALVLGGSEADGPPQSMADLMRHPHFAALGGRVRTRRAPGGGDPVELGAAWVHGAVHANPMQKLAAAAGAKMRASAWTRMHVLTASGQVAGKRHAKSVERRARRFMHAVARARRALKREDPSSTASLDQVIAQCRAQFDGTDAELALAVHMLVEQDYGAATAQLSALHFDQDEEFAEGGEPDAMVLGGYDRTIAYLLAPEVWRGAGPEGADPAPIDIRVGTAAAAVENLRDTVRVTTAAGHTIEADFCVVTVPLGVLKAGGLEFNPPLPERKREAIERLGCGLLNKVVLKYDREHWPRDVEFLAAESGPFRLFANLSAVTGQPILVAFVAGPEAAELEKLPDAETVARAHTAAAAILLLRAGQAASSAAANAPAAAQGTLPFPVAGTVTRWSRDPHARQSYTYLPPGATGADHVALGEPMGRTRFAGEAASRAFPGTVHGAYLSGLSAARDIVLDAGAEIGQGIDDLPGGRGAGVSGHLVDSDDDDGYSSSGGGGGNASDSSSSSSSSSKDSREG
jgi:hypothetical protein